jgi:hypothetical protein
MPASPTGLRAHDRRLLHGLRALEDGSLDRARAHLAAGLEVRRADLGWRGSGPAREGCVVGISMSRRQFWMHPLRAPALLLLAAIFDTWAYDETVRTEEQIGDRSRRLGPSTRARLAELLDLEWHRRRGWTEPMTPSPVVGEPTAAKIAR